jgi:hypothetical protein
MATSGELCMDCGRYRVHATHAVHPDDPHFECSACGAEFPAGYLVEP